MISNKAKMIYVGIVSFIINTMILGTTALATVNPGVKFGTWIQTNIAGIFIGVVAVIGITLVFSRQFMKALVTFVFVAIAAIFIFGGSDFAQKLGEIVKAWFQ